MDDLWGELKGWWKLSRKWCDITKRCGPGHYAVHSFFSGLDQFHYNDILPSLMELASEQGHMITTIVGKSQSKELGVLR